MVMVAMDTKLGGEGRGDIVYQFPDAPCLCQLLTNIISLIHRGQITSLVMKPEIIVRVFVEFVLKSTD